MHCVSGKEMEERNLATVHTKIKVDLMLNHPNINLERVTQIHPDINASGNISPTNVIPL